jgi:hypothetical protein
MNPTIYYTVGTVYFLLGILAYLFKKKADKNTEIQYSQGVLQNINKLEQKEPNNKPPLILYIVLAICSLPLLAIAGFSIWLWVSGKVPFKFDWSVLFFAFFFIILPLGWIIELLVFDQRRFKLGRSFVAKEASVDFDEDILTSFDRCLNTFPKINAHVIKFEKPKYMIATINNSKFTILFRRKNVTGSKANITCDSQWLTVRFDAGANRRYLNQFLKAL